jgi:hypothetical protein
MMKSFIAPGWSKVLQELGLDFNALWEMDLEPLDEPNTGRGPGGWSTVSCLSLKLPEGYGKRLILKRQQNHLSRTFLHPFRGIPTFEKEFSNILRYRKLGIPALEPVFYGQRFTTDGIQAILLTKYLEGYTPLDKLVSTYNKHGWPARIERNRLINALAFPIRKIHEKGLQHNCLHPKHLLIRKTDDNIEVRVIDLEKSKSRPLGNRRRVRDLESLHRRTGGFTRSDRVRFLYAYCGSDQLDKNAKRLCRKIIRQNWKKTNVDPDKLSYCKQK